MYTMFPVFSLVLDRDVEPDVALLYPELYKDLTKVGHSTAMGTGCGGTGGCLAADTLGHRLSLGTWGPDQAGQTHRPSRAREGWLCPTTEPRCQL